jgi:hypothetical protein
MRPNQARPPTVPPLLLARADEIIEQPERRKLLRCNDGGHRPVFPFGVAQKSLNDRALDATSKAISLPHRKLI